MVGGAGQDCAVWLRSMNPGRTIVPASLAGFILMFFNRGIGAKKKFMTTANCHGKWHYSRQGRV